MKAPNSLPDEKGSAGVITREQMIAQLRLIDPRFCAAAADLDPPETFDPGRRLSMNKDIAFFQHIAQYVVDDFASGKIEEHRKFLELLEDWIVDGDSYVIGATTNRLLELMEQETASRRISLAAILPIIGPRTRERWSELATIRIARNSHFIIRS